MDEITKIIDAYTGWILPDDKRKECAEEIRSAIKARIKVQARWENKALRLFGMHYADVIYEKLPTHTIGHYRATVFGYDDMGDEIEGIFDTEQEAKSYCEQELDKFIDSLLETQNEKRVERVK